MSALERNNFSIVTRMQSKHNRKFSKSEVCTFLVASITAFLSVTVCEMEPSRSLLLHHFRRESLRPAAAKPIKIQTSSSPARKVEFLANWFWKLLKTRFVLLHFPFRLHLHNTKSAFRWISLSEFPFQNCRIKISLQECCLLSLSYRTKVIDTEESSKGFSMISIRLKSAIEILRQIRSLAMMKTVGRR